MRTVSLALAPRTRCRDCSLTLRGIEHRTHIHPKAIE